MCVIRIEFDHPTDVGLVLGQDPQFGRDQAARVEQIAVVGYFAHRAVDQGVCVLEAVHLAQYLLLGEQQLDFLLQRDRDQSLEMIEGGLGAVPFPQRRDDAQLRPEQEGFVADFLVPRDRIVVTFPASGDQSEVHPYLVVGRIELEKPQQQAPRARPLLELHVHQRGGEQDIGVLRGLPQDALEMPAGGFHVAARREQPRVAVGQVQGVWVAFQESLRELTCALEVVHLHQLHVANDGGLFPVGRQLQSAVDRIGQRVVVLGPARDVGQREKRVAFLGVGVRQRTHVLHKCCRVALLGEQLPGAIEQSLPLIGPRLQQRFQHVDRRTGILREQIGLGAGERDADLCRSSLAEKFRHLAGEIAPALAHRTAKCTQHQGSVPGTLCEPDGRLEGGRRISPALGDIGEKEVENQFGVQGNARRRVAVG